MAAAKSSGRRRYGPKASKKVARSMHEMKRGKLRSGRSGRKVTSRKQAIAIGLSEARHSGGKVPKKRPSKSKRRKGATTRSRSSSAASKTKRSASKTRSASKAPRGTSTTRRRSKQGSSSTRRKSKRTSKSR